MKLIPLIKYAKVGEVDKDWVTKLKHVNLCVVLIGTRTLARLSKDVEQL